MTKGNLKMDVSWCDFFVNMLIFILFCTIYRDLNGEIHKISRRMYKLEVESFYCESFLKNYNERISALEEQVIKLKDEKNSCSI